MDGSLEVGLSFVGDVEPVSLEKASSIASPRFSVCARSLGSFDVRRGGGSIGGILASAMLVFGESGVLTMDCEGAGEDSLVGESDSARSVGFTHQLRTAVDVRNHT
jgi:hypothetical protein